MHHVAGTRGRGMLVVDGRWQARGGGACWWWMGGGRGREAGREEASGERALGGSGKEAQRQRVGGSARVVGGMVRVGAKRMRCYTLNCSRPPSGLPNAVWASRTSPSSLIGSSSSSSTGSAASVPSSARSCGCVGWPL